MPQGCIAATFSATTVGSQPQPEWQTGAKGFLGIGRCAPAIGPDVFRMLINTTGNSCQAGVSRPCWDPTGPNLQLHTGGRCSPILPPTPLPPKPPQRPALI